MIFCDELKECIKAIQKQMVAVKKNERAIAVKESKAAIQRVWLYCCDAQIYAITQTQLKNCSREISR